jgi:hypothetical protein
MVDMAVDVCDCTSTDSGVSLPASREEDGRKELTGSSLEDPMSKNADSAIASTERLGRIVADAR